MILKFAYIPYCYRVYMCICLYMHVYMLHVCICVHVCIGVDIYKCACVHVCVYIIICVYVPECKQSVISHAKPVMLPLLVLHLAAHTLFFYLRYTSFSKVMSAVICSLS